MVGVETAPQVLVEIGQDNVGKLVNLYSNKAKDINKKARISDVFKFNQDEEEIFEGQLARFLLLSDDQNSFHESALHMSKNGYENPKEEIIPLNSETCDVDRAIHLLDEHTFKIIDKRNNWFYYPQSILGFARIVAIWAAEKNNDSGVDLGDLVGKRKEYVDKHLLVKRTE